MSAILRTVALGMGISVVSIGCAVVAPPDVAGAATVSTLAGSGLPGFADGVRSSASFLMPVAVAYDSTRSLLVVDAAAQRIRRIRPDGRVETVAGSGQIEDGAAWVRGGFANGSRGAARVNWPQGIAVAKDGTIYVADTGNHCVRAIAPSGRVSLYAGSPVREGRDVGPRLQSTFVRPTGLSIDGKGALYVADPVIGLRKIDADGTVSVIALGRAPVGVTVNQVNNAQTLYVVDADGILIVYANGSKWRLRSLNDAGAASLTAFSLDPAGTVERDMAMQAPVGYPQSVAALPDGSLFYGDPRTNTIRYSFPEYAFAESLAGLPTEDAAGEGAGFRDGVDRDARFNAPLGTAISADGRSIAIADAGNRRIRLLTIDPLTDIAQRSSLVPLNDVPANAYRILYLGPSWTWYDSIGRDSISSQLERRLIADRALASTGSVPSVRFVNGVGTLEPLESLARTIAELSVDKLVILDMTQLTFDPDLQHLLDSPSAWQTGVATKLRAASAILAAAHIHFVVDIHPFPIEFSANEYPLSRMGLPALGAGRIPETRIAPLLRQAVGAAGVDLIDSYPDFRADALHPSEPISGTTDAHYGPHGRAVLADAIAHGLERLQPWAGTP